MSTGISGSSRAVGGSHAVYLARVRVVYSCVRVKVRVRDRVGVGDRARVRVRVRVRAKVRVRV